MTYNVAGLPTLFGGEGELNNIHVSPLLNGYDMVLIQEDFLFHDDLTSAIDYPYVTPKDTSGVIESGDGLIRMTEHPFSEFQRVTWVECFGFTTNASDCLTPKGFSVARHEIEPGVFLDVYNLHAEAGGAQEDIDARVAGLRQLVDFAEVFSDGNAIVMGGDWNSRFTDPTDILPEVMADLGLSDAWVEFVLGGTLPPLGPRIDDCVADGYSGADCEIIDKFFYRSSADLELSVLDYDVPRDAFSDANGVPLSDHDPIVVTFGFEAVPEPAPLALLGLAALALRSRSAVRLRRTR